MLEEARMLEDAKLLEDARRLEEGNEWIPRILPLNLARKAF